MGDDSRYLLDFLKVLHFSFPVLVVNPRTKELSLSSSLLPQKTLKNLPLALRTRENNWARLVGKSRYFLAPRDVEISNWSAHNPFDDMLSVESEDEF